MFREILEFVGIVIVAMLVVITIVALFMVMVWPIMAYTCDRLATLNQGIEFNYSFWTGCRANIDGVWVDSENLHYILTDIIETR